MEDSGLLQLEELLFPVVEVRTNGSHDPAGERAGTLLQYGQQLQKIEGQPGRYGLMVSVRSDNERSKNPPYAFAIEAHAVYSIQGGTLDEQAQAAKILANGVVIVMGAIREQLASITARGPWGRFLINAVPLQDPTQIASI